MIVPVVLLLCSLAGLYAATLPGFADAILLAVPCIVASLYLVLRGYLAQPTIRVRRDANAYNREKPGVARWKDVWSRGRKPPGRVIVIDGSNVMHWNGGEPQVETVRTVVDHLAALGFSPGVVFDANAGHILTGKYRHHAAMGSLLGLPEDRVMVVDKGTQADSIILAAAEDAGAQIVSNDRYRDWADTHALVREPGRIVRGGYTDGKLWLDSALEGANSATP